MSFLLGLNLLRIKCPLPPLHISWTLSLYHLGISMFDSLIGWFSSLLFFDDLSSCHSVSI